MPRFMVFDILLPGRVAVKKKKIVDRARFFFFVFLASKYLF